MKAMKSSILMTSHTPHRLPERDIVAMSLVFSTVLQAPNFATRIEKPRTCRAFVEGSGGDSVPVVEAVPETAIEELVRAAGEDRARDEYCYGYANHIP